MEHIMFTYFCLTFALLKLPFQGKFHYVGHVAYQKIEFEPIRIQNNL